MFTGIVSDLGAVRALEKKGDLRARIGTSYDVNGIDLGASIACDGVCLTVVSMGTDGGNWFDVEISAESVNLTNISGWEVGRTLNLERALRLGDELGGHIVSGHVDGLAVITSIKPSGDSHVVWLEVPQALAKFVAPKGSVSGWYFLSDGKKALCARF